MRSPNTGAGSYDWRRCEAMLNRFGLYERHIDGLLIRFLHVRSESWKIEVFHKIMKSGCKAEDSKLRTAERLVNLIATFCIMSWRIFLDDDAQPT
jgi:hypothetical protein